VLGTSLLWKSLTEKLNSPSAFVYFQWFWTFGLDLVISVLVLRIWSCLHHWCTEPNSSRWICHSIWQQSAAVFYELWKQKLMNNFSYCLLKGYLKDYTTVMSLSCHACIEINEN